jgi:hypothetical protein
VVTPINAAIALNEECTACTTVALAYQYVLGVGQPLRFTPEGRKRIAAIRKEFKRLERSGLPLEEILARVNELRAELVDVLNTELVVAGGDPGQPGGDQAAGEDGGPQTAGGTGPEGGGADGGGDAGGAGEPRDGAGGAPATAPEDDAGGSAPDDGGGGAPAGGGASSQGGGSSSP